MKRIFSCSWLLLVFFLILVSCNDSPGESRNEVARTISLEDGWRIRSSVQGKETGETISTPGFSVKGWYRTAVPATVLAALVKNRCYPAPYWGKNLEKIPGEPFQHSWWYRREFDLEELPPGSTVRLVLEGINYRAAIWLNGEEIAPAHDIVGPFRIFELDIGPWVKPRANALALEVFPPQRGDFAIGFADWNPAPPDKSMGLWRGVKLRLSGPVSLNHPFVQSKVDLETLDRAELTVTVDLINHSRHPVFGQVKGEIGKVCFRQAVELKPLEKRAVVFHPAAYRQLQWKNPRLWWPHTLGTPHLYRLKLSAHYGPQEKISDRCEISFGIREAADYLTKDGQRGYKINGKEVLIRGGGWVDDLLLVEDERRLRAQFDYIKHMNLNALRLEGFWGSSQKLYDLADRCGILIMVGWNCQWEWQRYLGKPVDEFGGIQTPAEMEQAARSFRDQVLWLRHHPSILAWVLASDKLPRPALEAKYHAYLDRLDPSRPRLAAGKFHVSTVSGATAVKMKGPYDYVPPVYWYIDRENGGAFGFNSESGPGPQPPPLESIARMIPADRLWPSNEVWEFHCGRKEFNRLNRYMYALERRYGKPKNPEDFDRKAQAANYEAIRAMFEAFAVNRPAATGIIHWMLNSAWPKMVWQLYDYYLMPSGAFYGTKAACQPLNLVYHYGNNAIYLVNDTCRSYQDLTAAVRIFNLDSRQVYGKTLPAAGSEQSSVKILDIPLIKQLSPVYFIDLKLENQEGDVIGTNFYWQSVKADTLDEKGTTWFVTPMKEYADFTALQNLPGVTLQVTHAFESLGPDQQVRVTLKNPTDKLAFFIELKVVGEQSGDSILPVFWDDNYISLLPGESKTLTGRFSVSDTRGENPRFAYSGWNVN